MAQLLPRRSSSRGGGRAGYTLVEVLVAMLISAVMITAVFGVALTSKQGSGAGMRRLLANEGVAQVSAQLKTYVNACCAPSNGACVPPFPSGNTCTSAGAGPNTLNTVNGGWSMSDGGTGSANLKDCAGAPPTCAASAGRNVWALMCGDHFITGINATLEAAPYNGYIHYTVTGPGGASCAATPQPLATGAPTIAFSSNWTEP